MGLPLPWLFPEATYGERTTKAGEANHYRNVKTAPNWRRLFSSGGVSMALCRL